LAANKQHSNRKTLINKNYVATAVADTFAAAAAAAATNEK